MPSRRDVLALLSSAPFAPALAGCAADNLPDPVAGWRDPGAGEADPRRFALAHAILAPNPHNTQPWLVELDDADGGTGASAPVAYPAANYDQIVCGAPAPCVAAGDNATFPSNASTVAGSVGFTATAVASIDNDATIDSWHVNDIKAGLTAADIDDVVS